MFDFNNVKLIDDNNLNSVEREFLINSFLTLENLPKIFKLLYNVDIKISEEPIYLIDDYNHDKPIYKIIYVNVDLLSNVLQLRNIILNIQKGGYEVIEFTNSYFKITYTYKSNTFDDFIKCITYNKEDFDYKTLKTILHKL